MVIRNKTEAVTAWEKGDFGNRLRMWPSVDSLIKSDYHGQLTVRSYDVSSPKCYYNVDAFTVRSNPLGYQGAYFNESAPDQFITIQGESIFHGATMRLIYSHLPTKMRVALANAPQLADGLTATIILERYMDPSSLDCFRDLQNRYPDHAIEFSCYRINLGNIPGRNTLFWEVRNY